MRITVSLAVIVFTLPVLAQDAEVSDHVLQRAIATLPHHLHSVEHPDLEDVGDRNYAVSDATVGGAEDRFGKFVLDWHGRVIADELIEAYHRNSESSQRITAGGNPGVPVLRLDGFLLSGMSYDWQRLNERHPDVRAIVRLSRPAVDRLSTYAVIRYEIVARTGPVWAGFHEFEKQADGSWKTSHGIVGDLWR